MNENESGAQFAARQHLQTVKTQETIIHGQQREIERLSAEVARLTAAAPTDLSTRLRESADAVMLQADRAKLMRSAADEIERYYGGMMAWKRSAEMPVSVIDYGNSTS